MGGGGGVPTLFPVKGTGKRMGEGFKEEEEEELGLCILSVTL